MLQLGFSFLGGGNSLSRVVGSGIRVVMATLLLDAGFTTILSHKLTYYAEDEIQ